MVDSNTSVYSANSANSTLTTNFNVTPYYDDYDRNKEFYRILFKPGFAVQARELTQMQTILQNQILRFGKHVFKDGDIVLPGAFNLKANANDKKGNPINYVKIKTNDITSNEVVVDNFLGETVTGATSNISAQIVSVLDSDGTTSNTKTFYVTYLGASPSDPTIRVFQAGETLTSANAGTAVVLDSDPVANTGYAAWFQIDEGVYFAKDHFITFPTQSIVLDRYNANPTCRVGFFVNEEIINSAMDSSLLDPALESSNYAAPGADRLKLVSQLSVVPYDYVDYPDFVTLFTIKDGVIQISNEKTQYNILGDSLATRTYDESGDYIVKGYNVQIQEHDLVTTPVNNYGRFTNGDNSKLIVNIDPGHGYVKGYSVSLNDKYAIDITKPKNYKNVSSQITSTTMGQYVTVNELVGTWILDKGRRINFYDIPQRRITAGGTTSVTTNFKWSIGSQTGNNIGSGIINNIEYVSGTPGYDGQYNIYLSDITMTGSNTFSNVRSLYYSQSPSSIGADILGAGNTTSNTVLQGLAQAPLLYYVGANYTKSVRASDGTAATIYYFNRTAGVDTTITTSANGVLNLSPSLGTGESIPYTGVLSSTDVSQDITLTFNESINIGPLWGGATVSSTGNNMISGVGTYFNFFNIGDKIELQDASANTFYVTGIISNTVMTVSNNVPGSITTSKIFKAYKTGDTIKLTGKGVANGGSRTVTATSSSLSIDLKETFSQEVDSTVSYKIALTNTSEATKTLTPNRYVKIDCSSAGTTGPFCLGFSDVYRIRNIVKKTGSAPSSLADGTDVTRYFTLDNGQRDTLYDLAKIVKSPAISLGGTDYLLVHLDYFVPNYTSKGAYFSIDSYTIQDDDALSSNSTIRTENVPVYVSPVSSSKFNLRNFLDFRPVKSITATDATTPGTATTNPSNTSTTYQQVATGMKFPVPSTEVIYDYSYYMGRKDIVVVTKDGTLAVIQGGAADYPLVPDALDTQMTLAVLDIAPYPSLSPAYANALQRKDLSCGARKVSIRGYTMRDIGILDKRIKNLEYYTSLTLLEKDAVNLKILDDAGNDRFKNGIFIDTFKDTSLSAKGVDADFRIVTDPIELAIRPLFSTNSFKYNYISGDVAVNANKVTFNYTEDLFFTQRRVTDFRNLERGTYDFQGVLTLFPSQDVWIDTSYAPDEVVTFSANGATLSVSVSTTPDIAANVVKSYMNTTWEDWKTQVVGFNLYRGQGASKRFVGRFNTEAEARAAAASWTSQPNMLPGYDIYNAPKGDAATLETIYYNKRLGTNWFSNESTDTAVGGNRLISSEIIPYIRPQEIVVKAMGLKPYSLLNIFFDGVNVTNYCVPLTAAQFEIAIAKNPLPIDTVAGAPDDNIVGTDGNAYFIFKITSDGPKFRTGERKMVVMDGLQIAPATIEAELDASTFASSYFFADGTKQTLQRTVYSTDGYRITGENTSEEKTTYSDLILPNTFTNPPRPKGYCCFNPEAKVLMANKTWKPIGEIEEGEQVIGEDESINTVIKNNKVVLGSRSLMKFESMDGGEFYTTDDHLFLTKKGWKTWDPEYVLNDPNTINKDFLIGENRTKSIDNDDYLKKIEIVNGKIVSNFIPYADLGVTKHKFDPEYKVHDLTLEGNATYIVEGYIVHNCCVAYTILVKAPADEEGIFVTSYDVFIQRKSQTRGIWFELREMDSAGNITDTQIPGSAVYYTNDQVTVSNDGITNPTNVKFDAPIFLFNNKPYAFVIHSFSPGGASIDPDTNIWVARLGEKDINTGAVNNERQRMGKFFQTTNNKQWYEILDVDLPINVYRAKFNTGTTTFTIGNEAVEKFLLANVSSSLSGREGDHFITGDTLTLTAANGTISVGYRLTGNTSLGAANGTVISIPSANKYELSNTRYKIGEKVDMYYSGNNQYAQVSAVVTAIANSSAQLDYYTESASNVYAEFISSTGGFAKNTVIQSVRNAGYAYRAEVTDVKDFNYSAISWEPNVLDFVKTNISYEMETYANGSTTSSGYETVYPSETHYFEEEKVIYCKTNEIVNFGTGVSNKVRVTLQSNSEWVSPLFDLNSSHALVIDKLINANTTSEDAQSGGAALNKYISQTIILADGQDAEDLNVYLSAYRPPGTDVKVYCKLLNATDGETLAQKYWIEMPKLGDGDITYSSISNRYNFRELSYGLPASMMTGPNGEVQYTAGGATFTSYKYYAIKIVLVADNSAVVPRVADLRAIALQL